MLSDFNDGSYNMAVDEAILKSAEENPDKPTLRLYGWKPACLSLGYFQKLEETANVEKCRELGIDIVRRPSGGGAILHDMELTYSFTIAFSNPAVPKKLTESYFKISEALLLGMEKIGIKAKLRKGEDVKHSVHPYCFARESSFDIVHGGKKLIGSAQRRTEKALLQHGSIMIDINYNQIADIIKDCKSQSEVLTEKIISINEVLGNSSKKITYNDVQTAVLSGFKEKFSVDFDEEPLPETTLTLAHSLSKTTYNILV